MLGTTSPARGGVTAAGAAAYRRRADRLTAAGPPGTRHAPGPAAGPPRHRLSQRRAVDAGGGVGGGVSVAPAARPARLLGWCRGVWGRHWGNPAVVTVAVAAVVGLVLRLTIVARPLDVLDRMFIPDDTYYTLGIARSLAHGLGPTTGVGAPVTSGFQPLVAFLEAPIFWVTDSPDTGLRIALILLAVCDTLTVIWLGRLAYRLAGTPAAAVAATVWALSPLAIAQAAGGLETALATMLAVGLVDAWLSARRHPSTPRWVWCGAIAGLGVLARIDVLLLVGLLITAELATTRTRADLLALTRTGAAIAVGAAITLGPWWSYCLLTFGSPIPASGAAVRQLVALHQLSAAQEAGWGAGTILTAPFVLLQSLRGDLFATPTLAVTAFVGLVAAGITAAVVLGRRGGRGDPRRVAAVLPLFAVGLLGFYSLYLGAVWFDTRYLAPVTAVATLLVALTAATAWTHRRHPAALGGLTLLSLALGVSVAGDARDLLTSPTATVDIGYDGAKGYREAATDTLAATPPGAVLGSLQSGALSYYADTYNVQVINLDGVVDPAAAQALTDHDLAGYAATRGVTYFADWPFNLDVLFRTSHPDLTPTDVTLIHATQQGPDAFTLWHLTPPPP